MGQRARARGAGARTSTGAVCGERIRALHVGGKTAVLWQPSRVKRAGVDWSDGEMPHTSQSAPVAVAACRTLENAALVNTWQWWELGLELGVGIGVVGGDWNWGSGLRCRNGSARGVVVGT